MCSSFIATFAQNFFFFYLCCLRERRKVCMCVCVRLWYILFRRVAKILSLSLRKNEIKLNGKSDKKAFVNIIITII